MKWAIGIDPGKDGGVAILSGRAAFGVRVDTTDAGALLRAVADARRAAARTSHVTSVIVGIEAVVPFRKAGTVSSFRFGVAFGVAHGVVVGLGLPLVLVSPAAWHRIARPGVNGAPLKERKGMVLAAARERWPEVNLDAKATQPIADALFIALTALRG